MPCHLNQKNNLKLAKSQKPWCNRPSSTKDTSFKPESHEEYMVGWNGWGESLMTQAEKYGSKTLSRNFETLWLNLPI